MEITEAHIYDFQIRVFAFYAASGRDLPWRKTTDPYRILISEFMLQQTQVSRVIERYATWIEMWPTINHVAQASRIEILRAWMGLGYYTRAGNLHNAAKMIVADYRGDVLQAVRSGNKIPGIGAYTARAVQVFAANDDLALVDTNIRRILIHEFGLCDDVPDGDIWKAAERCLPRGRSREWHNALMDYGALHLTGKKTGIKPRTRQPAFRGSDRQIRAQILRMLLEGPASLCELQPHLSVTEERLHRILDKMVHEKLLIARNRLYHLAS